MAAVAPTGGAQQEQAALSKKGQVVGQVVGTITTGDRLSHSRMKARISDADEILEWTSSASADSRRRTALVASSGAEFFFSPDPSPFTLVFLGGVMFSH